MLPTFRLRRKKVSQKESLIKQNNSNNPSISASLIVLELHRHRHKANCKLTKLGKCQVYKYRYRYIPSMCVLCPCGAYIEKQWWPKCQIPFHSQPSLAFRQLQLIWQIDSREYEWMPNDSNPITGLHMYMRDSTTTQCTYIQPTKLTCVHEMGNLIGQN